MNPYRASRYKFPDPVSPFDDHDGIRVAEDRVKTEMPGLDNRIQAIGINVNEMPKAIPVPRSCGQLIPLDKNKGRALHALADAERAG